MASPSDGCKLYVTILRPYAITLANKARKSSTPSPVKADSDTTFSTWSRAARNNPARFSGGTASILFKTSTTRRSDPYSTPKSCKIPTTSAFCAAWSGRAISRTCTIISAYCTCSNVARNDATKWVGKSAIKPTVSARIISLPSGNLTRRMVGSSVAKGKSSAKTLAPVNRLNNVDLPALVYPTNDITGNGTFSRPLRCKSRVRRIWSKSRFNWAMRSVTKRRSISNWVSPGPPVLPIPPRWRSKCDHDLTR